MSSERRHVVITGGASGIGAAVMQRALRAGHRVTVIDRSPSAAAGSTAYAVDVTDAEALRAAMHDAIAAGNGLDALVCAAGIAGSSVGDGAVASVAPAAFDTVINTNLRGAFLAVGAAWDALRESRGSIVTVASVLGLTGGGGPFRSHAYISSKGGLIALTRALAADGLPVGVRANCVAPALVATPLTARVSDDDELRSYVARRQPLLGGFMQPDDVAAPIEFLYSTAARAVTGQVLAVDAGWTLEPTQLAQEVR